MSETMAAPDDATQPTGDLRWEPAYDRASVEQFLDEAAARRDELRSQLAHAQARVARARAELERREASRSAELASMVADAHRQLAELEVDHDAAVEAAWTAANDEVERIRKSAAAASRRGDDDA